MPIRLDKMSGAFFVSFIGIWATKGCRVGWISFWELSPNKGPTAGRPRCMQAALMTIYVYMLDTQFLLDICFKW